MSDNLKALIIYRLEQANDALHASDMLLNEQLWRD
jgi:hypothetical protein